MSGGLYYNPKKKKPKPSLKDRPKRRAIAEEYMTKDYRDFPDRKKLEK
jgi:hypothetical protein|tara:strand:+ start:3788 stop:3931 length:144 start_codon:yes stop_codon:yes gene_type:complete